MPGRKIVEIPTELTPEPKKSKSTPQVTRKSAPSNVSPLVVTIDGITKTTTRRLATKGTGTGTDVGTPVLSTTHIFEGKFEAVAQSTRGRQVEEFVLGGIPGIDLQIVSARVRTSQTPRRSRRGQ